MKCPVCSTSGLPEDSNSCQSCGSDLEALQLTGMIRKSGKGRLLFAYIISALLVLVIIIWIVNCRSSGRSDIENTAQNTNELNELSQELEQQKEVNGNLQTTIEEMKAEINKRVEAKESNKKQWIVKEGESLFQIARTVYGNGFKYLKIAEDNNIEDPDALTAGQKLTIYY